MKSAITLEQLQVEWPKLLQQEEEKFNECCALDRETSETNKEKEQAVREWWCLVNAILWMFVRTRAQYDHELQPFPAFTLTIGKHCRRSIKRYRSKLRRRRAKKRTTAVSE